MVAARVVVVVVKDIAREGDKVVLMIGCLVEFVKEYTAIRRILEFWGFYF